MFAFRVPLTGEHVIEVRYGVWADFMTIRKVEKVNPGYAQDGGEVVNWFDKPEEATREGYFSILDMIEDIKKKPMPPSCWMMSWPK